MNLRHVINESKLSIYARTGLRDRPIGRDMPMAVFKGKVSRKQDSVGDEEAMRRR